MLKKRSIKRKLFSLAMLALGAYSSLGCYKPLHPDDMREADLVCNSTEVCPDNFDGLSYQKAIELVQTPEDAETYMAWAEDGRVEGHPFFYDAATNNGFRTNSFKVFHETCHTAPFDCTEQALGKLAMLHDNGVPAYFLNMASETYNKAHAVPVWKIDGKYGIIGGSEMYGSINELVEKQWCDKWLLIDLDDQWRKDWVSGSGNYFNRIGSKQTVMMFWLRELFD